ncbi:hypothetical protein MNBD_GAMMA09-3829 [hydrothermal vent metagenome]|uniref:Rhodanese domain-containing protein n=1 Tax=hydrothermal vent metagenome TaxID=652676 RepID=A0A3B0X032_9ZZZZ
MKYIIITILSLISSGLMAEESFPGRTKYPQVPYIELESLYKQRGNVIFIDARSPYEYETLRIKGAYNIPLILPPKLYKQKVMSLRQANPGKKLVFYCNGHKCMKSYKAARKVIIFMGLKHIYAFDSGVFTWAKKYPENSLLLGRELTGTDELISKEKFESHVLPAKQFIKTANGVAILDIRDRIERDGFYIFSGEETSISLNLQEKDKLDRFIDNVNKNNRTLYVYDMVGKQVRWFQYYLESKGIGKYFFMKGGAEAFFKIPLSEFLD